MMRSGNPALSETVFELRAARGQETMTLSGTVNKTGILLLLVVLGASVTWSQVFAPGGASGLVMPLTWGGGIGAFLLAMVTIFKKEWAALTAPLYAGLEGLFLGGISAILEAQFPGVVIQATMLTFGTLFCLLAAYRSGMIRATENFKLGLVAATGAIFLIYLVSFGMRLFGMSMPYIHDSGLVGIGFSLVVVAVAALNLVMDFDFIEQGAARGAPKHLEWYGAFGLIVTLAWLYIEILRLLAKLQRRD